MQSLHGTLLRGSLQSATGIVHRLALHEQALPASAVSQPSTSGRESSTQIHVPSILIRCFSAASPEGTPPSKANTPAGKATSTTSAVAPSSPSPSPSTSSPSSSSATSGAQLSTPFYAGLAQRYPNPDAVPEALLHRLRQQLFGRPIQLHEKTGRRALARPLQGRVLADWYFLPPREVPGFHNEEREYRASKALNRRQKKGAGEEAAEAGGKAGGKKK